MNELAIQESVKELELERESYRSEPQLYKAFHDKYIWCVFCGKPEIQAHHIVYRSQGGKTTLANLCPLCDGCHKQAHGQVVSGKEPFTLMWADYKLTVVQDSEIIQTLTLDAHEPTAQDGEAAHALHTVILNLKEQVEGTFFELGNALRDMRDSHHYKTLDYGTFEAYLASPELSIQRVQAYRLMSVSEYAERLELDVCSLLHIDKDKLAIVLPRATKENVEDKIAEARSLSRSDLRELYSSEPKAPGSKPTVVEPIVVHQHTCHKCGAVNEYEGA